MLCGRRKTVFDAAEHKYTNNFVYTFGIQDCCLVVEESLHLAEDEGRKKKRCYASIDSAQLPNVELRDPKVVHCFICHH